MFETIRYISKKSERYRSTFGTFQGLSLWWNSRNDYKLKAGTPYSLKLPGLNQPVTLRAGTCDREVFSQIFLDRELALPLETDPLVIVDAGANIGLSTLFLAAKFPNARFICIEPEEQNFLLLEKNTCHLGRVQLLQAALWHQSDTLQINNPDAAAYAFRVGPQTQTHQATIAVRAVTMGQVLDMLPPEQNIDLLKIDIEGAERRLFSEGTHGWMERVNALAIELHDRLEPGCREALVSAIGSRPHTWREFGEYQLIVFRESLN